MKDFKRGDLVKYVGKKKIKYLDESALLQVIVIGQFVVRVRVVNGTRTFLLDKANIEKINIMEDKNMRKAETKSKVKVKIDKVIFNDKTTIVYFDDGSEKLDKQVATQAEGEEVFDPEVGLAIAIASHVFGSKKKFKEYVNKQYKKSQKNKIKKDKKNK